jgi:hypothetical protein
MSETNAVVDTSAPVAATEPEPKLGKPKLAKAKKKEPAPPVLDANGQPVPDEVKKVAIPRISPFAGKHIFLNRANEVIGAEGKNPKRPGSNGHMAFSMYVEGTSVEAQLELWKTVMVTTKTGKQKPVGDMADIRWDTDHGFIEVR